jgi:phosphatidylglycerol:prolipoprotein diacylglycerol transferase
MFPDLLTIGPLTVHTYGLFVATGFFAGLIVTLKIAKSQGITPHQVLDMGLLIIISAIVGSRLLYVFMNFSYYLQNPLDMLKIWQGGLTFSGGIIFAVLVMFLYVRRQHLSFLRIGDLWAPAAAIGQGIGRIGCFMAGCCYGGPTDLIWGVVFTHPDSLAPLNISLHPTQIYSSLSGFIIFLILLGLNSKKVFEGQVFLWFLILHSTARLLFERFRGDDRGILLNSSMSITQLVTILILIASVTLLMVLRYKANKQSQIAS